MDCYRLVFRFVLCLDVVGVVRYILRLDVVESVLVVITLLLDLWLLYVFWRNQKVAQTDDTCVGHDDRRDIGSPSKRRVCVMKVG